MTDKPGQVRMETAVGILRCHAHRVEAGHSKHSYCANCMHGAYENGPCPTWNEKSFLITDGVLESGRVEWRCIVCGLSVPAAPEQARVIVCSSCRDQGWDADDQGAYRYSICLPEKGGSDDL